MVELKQTPDQFVPEHTEGVIQVNSPAALTTAVMW